MAIKSEPLKDGQKIEKTRTAPEIYAAGVGLLVFGALLWIAGARYTFEGWIVALNWFAAWLRLPARIPPITGWWMALAIPIGLVYSLVETKRPWERNVSAAYWTIWALLVATDWGSTYLGIAATPTESWPIAVTVAQSVVLASAWAFVLTFTPEWLLRAGARFLRR